MLSERDGNRPVSYSLLKLPKFDTEKVMPEFRKLVIEKLILQMQFIKRNINGYRLYAIIDGALNKEIDLELELYKVSNRTLYPDGYRRAAGYAQPFLVDLESSAEFLESFIKSYGHGMGVFMLSRLDIETIRDKMKVFAIGTIRDGGKETFFRFYDPKIFPAFLTIASNEHIFSIFENEAIFFCENFIDEKLMDIYIFDATKKTLLKASCDLTDQSTSTPIPYRAPIEGFDNHHIAERAKKPLVFGAGEIDLLSQYRLRIHAKRAAYSLIKQYRPYAKRELEEIYSEVLYLAEEGYDLGLHDSEANYLWIVANIMNKSVKKLQKHDIYYEIFDKTENVTQGRKEMLLEKLIEELEEKQ